MNLRKYFTLDNKYMQLGLFALAFMVLAIEPSFAQNGGNGAVDFSGVDVILRDVLTAITGPIGVSVAGIAVVSVGFLFMTGRMDWQFAIAVIVGIAIVFGAATFVDGFVAN